MHKVTLTFFIVFVFSLLGFGCLPESSLASQKYDRLPPLKSREAPDEPGKKIGKEKKFQRRIYRLPKNEFDLKIVYSDKKKGVFATPYTPQIGFAIHCSDINGDGIQDIIIGAPYPEGPVRNRDNLEKVYLIFGRKKLPRVVDLNRADLILFRPYSPHSARFGQAIASGDLNGDGFNDLILGAPHSSGGESKFRAGEVYVLFGRKRMSGKKNIEKVADLIITGTEVTNETGFAVASGDINDDGIDGLIIAAPYANGPDNKRIGSGEIYVIYGGKIIKRSIDLANEADLTIWGAVKRAFAGYSLASGDFSGDGIDDIIIGTGSPHLSSAEV